VKVCTTDDSLAALAAVWLLLLILRLNIFLYSRAHKADHSCSGGIVQKASAITDVCKTVAGNQGKQPHKAAFASHIIVAFSMVLPVAFLQCSPLIVDVHVVLRETSEGANKKLH